MKRGVLVGGVLGALAAVGLLSRGDEEPPSAAEQQAGAEIAEENPPAGAEEAPSKRAVIARSAARRRPASAQVASPAAASEAASPSDAVADAAEADTAAPLDVPEPYELPPGASVPDAIRGAVEDVLPLVKGCVEDWIAAEGALDGEVVVEFQLGPDGLGEAAVADREGLPPLVEGCFATALYAASWPRLPEETLVRYPFSVTTAEEDIPQD